MISERTFAESYPTFWKELLPGGTRYIKFINGSASERVSDEVRAFSRPEVRSIISQTAFNLVKKGFLEFDLPLLSDDKVFEVKIWEESVQDAQKFISRFSNKPEDLNLSIEESKECIKLARSMWNHIKSEGFNKDIIFEPKFTGWGLLNPSKGDVLIGDCLMEIKAVEGAFGISDIRQILIYGTLNYLTKTYPSMIGFELYNPRLGKRYEDSFDKLAQGVAGCSGDELFLEISNHITDKITSL